MAVNQGTPEIVHLHYIDAKLFGEIDVVGGEGL